MEEGKQHEEEQSSVDGASDKLQRQENEGGHDDQYAEDEGEDENGPKPSADEAE